MKLKAEQEVDVYREKFNHEALDIVKRSEEIAITKGLEEETRILSAAGQTSKNIIDEAWLKAMPMVEQSKATTLEIMQKLNQSLLENTGQALEIPTGSGDPEQQTNDGEESLLMDTVKSTTDVQIVT